jgi:hypothetical protein
MAVRGYIYIYIEREREREREISFYFMLFCDFFQRYN